MEDLANGLITRSVKCIAHHLKEKGLNIRVLSPNKKSTKIYIRNKHGYTKYELTFWRRNKGKIDILIVGDPKYPSYNASKNLLFTLNLYNPSSIVKLDEWLEENKSKLM